MNYYYFVKDIIKIIGKLPNKTCGLDPVPTWIIKKLPGTMAPIIADIINIIDL